MSQPMAAVASQDDALITETDNAGDPGAADVTQDPAVVLLSETDSPAEVLV